MGNLSRSRAVGGVGSNDLGDVDRGGRVALPCGGANGESSGSSDGGEAHFDGISFYVGGTVSGCLLVED